jgi:hypothetical protein
LFQAVFHTAGPCTLEITHITAVTFSQYVYMFILPIDKGFFQTEQSHLSCAELFKCVQNIPGDLRCPLVRAINFTFVIKKYAYLIEKFYSELGIESWTSSSLD